MKMLSFATSRSICALALGCLLLLSGGTGMAQDGKSVRYARGTWDSFWVGGYVVQVGLERLGYKVEPPLTLNMTAIYSAMSDAQVAFTVDGMFPNQADVAKKFEAAVVKVGPISSPASVAGYLIDKKTAEKYGIQYLDQLVDPKVAALFGEGGKARMVGVDPTWSKGTLDGTAADLKNTGLEQTVEMQSGSYDMIMADTIARYNAGKPVLIFSWYPNAYTLRLKPGTDLVWLSMRPGKARERDGWGTGEIAGCAVSGPTCYGVNPSDYTVMANKKWLADNPRAAKFLTLVRFPMSDRVTQNAKMGQPGQKTDAAIRRHAEEWIAANSAKFDEWIEQAKAAGPK